MKPSRKPVKCGASRPRASWSRMPGASARARWAAGKSSSLRSVFRRVRLALGFGAWNGVLFGQPRTQINDPAALAAKRPKWRLIRPFDAAPAGRALHCGWHGAPLSADGQCKRHILFDRRGAGVKSVPLQEADIAAKLAATADFRKQTVL